MMCPACTEQRLVSELAHRAVRLRCGQRVLDLVDELASRNTKAAGNPDDQRQRRLTLAAL